MASQFEHENYRRLPPTIFTHLIHFLESIAIQGQNFSMSIENTLHTLNVILFVKDTN